MNVVRLALSLFALGGALGSFAPSAAAAPATTGPDGPIVTPRRQPNVQCRHSDQTPCTTHDLTDPSLLQIVFLATGYAAADAGAFWAEYERAIEQMTGASAGTAWSAQQKSKLLFIGDFTGGAALGSSARFGGTTYTRYDGRNALTLDEYSVASFIASERAGGLAWLRPFAVGVIFDTNEPQLFTATAPPSFTRRAYGIAKISARAIEDGPYTLTHELAHAGLNFLDERTEQSLANTNLRGLDVLSALVRPDGTWSGDVAAISDLIGVYDIRLSDILANNGNDNVATSRHSATVSTTGFTPEDYAYEGGLFFGRGVWHHPGANLMDDNVVVRGPDDGFAYAHSSSQQRVIDRAFGAATSIRPNDRLRNAGPISGWPIELGSTTHVVLADADKNHHFQPTSLYRVQVGWWERNWKTCWAAFVPYPCYDSVWTTAEKDFVPQEQSIEIQLASSTTELQRVLCDMGLDHAIGVPVAVLPACTSVGVNGFDVVPSMKLETPYLDVAVPATQWMTTYFWRFSAQNGATTSGSTAWSSFFRSL